MLDFDTCCIVSAAACTLALHCMDALGCSRAHHTEVDVKRDVCVVNFAYAIYLLLGS